MTLTFSSGKYCGTKVGHLLYECRHYPSYKNGVTYFGVVCNVKVDFLGDVTHYDVFDGRKIRRYAICNPMIANSSLMSLSPCGSLSEFKSTSLYEVIIMKGK